MDGFAFITETDRGSGIVGCAAVRKVIRTHIMQTHWANKTGAGNTGFAVPGSKQPQPQPHQQKLPAAHGRRIVLGKDTAPETEAETVAELPQLDHVRKSKHLEGNGYFGGVRTALHLMYHERLEVGGHHGR